MKGICSRVVLIPHLWQLMGVRIHKMTCSNMLKPPGNNTGRLFYYVQQYKGAISLYTEKGSLLQKSFTHSLQVNT